MTQQASRLSSSERALARVGTLVRKYRIERLIGMGGMAAVYAATHEDGHRVAIKFMLERFRDEPGMLELFAREASVANQIGHPGAVPVLDYSADEDGAFFIMPLLEGETLRARAKRAQGRLPVAEVGVLMSDALDIIATAHARGIVHRDIKPENLFVTRAGEVKVLDFGIARRIDNAGSATITGNMIGTPAFMPPEQALGKSAAIGPASDCWAAAATIFTLLSGEPVHPAESAPEQLAAAATRRARSLADAAPRLPAAIVQFVDRALAFEVLERWPSAREMRDALRTAFERALGESFSAMESQIRSEIANEMLQEPEVTLPRVLPRDAHAAMESATVSREPRADLSAIEFDGGGLLSYVHLLPRAVQAIFAEHGLGQVTDDGTFIADSSPWRPAATWADITIEISRTLGATRTTELAKIASQYQEIPSSVRDIHTIMRTMGVSLHSTHRKIGRPLFDTESQRALDGFGHFRYRGEPGENFIVMESSMPYACDWQRGCLFGIARRFEPHSQVEHAPGPCRKRGDESCIYHITWW